MNAIELISQDLFDKVRSRYSNLEMGDEAGNVTSDPRQARFFDFDFTMEGNNLGRVSISINERGTLKLFYGQGILEGHDPITQEIWFKFLREMRMFAKRRLLRFDTRDITKSNLDKTDFKYLASTGTKEDTMSESKMFGGKFSSYLPLERTRLIIRHKKDRPVDETIPGARTRNIECMYVENADGERFKYPFIHLAGAKAMQRHVANGGRPHDECGQAIIIMSEEIAQLNAFKRHVGKHDSMQTEANEIMERAQAKLENLRHKINCLSKQRHYEDWKESFSPHRDEEMVMDQATMETYKHKFTVNNFNEELAQYFPLIHRIMQETGEVNLDEYVGEAQEEKCDECGMWESKCECDHEKEVKEFAEFTEWADSIVEDHLPDDVIANLKDLLNSDAKTGLDGTNAIQSLQGIGIQDDELEGMIKSAGPDGDLKTIIAMWLNSKGDTDAIKELELDAQASAEAPPSEQPPAGAEPGTAPPAPAEEEELERDSNSSPKKPSMREVAEMVKSFYDRETGKFPLGEHGVVTKVKKELGEWAGALAEKLVQHLSSRGMEHEGKPMHHDMEQEAFEDIIRLSGIKK
jgi:hypothetical protein